MFITSLCCNKRSWELKRRLFVKFVFDGENEADVARDVELDVKGRFKEDSATPKWKLHN